MNPKEQITAALKKLGPSAPRAVADHLGMDSAVLSYHVRAMLEANPHQLKAAGKTSDRIIALPDQKIEEARPAPKTTAPKKNRKPKRKKKGGAKVRRSVRKAPMPEPELLAAFATDDRLVLIRHAQDPQIFSSAETRAIADLICSRFEA